ncbi:hypothetical protein [Bradyrhizobium sp.]
MSTLPELRCEECGEAAVGIDDDGCAICDDCALETYGDLESLLRVALKDN